MYCHTIYLSFYIGEKRCKLCTFFSVHQPVGLGFRRGVLYVWRSLTRSCLPLWVRRTVEGGISQRWRDDANSCHHVNLSGSWLHGLRYKLCKHSKNWFHRSVVFYSTSFYTYVSSIKRLKRIQSDKTSLENGKHVKFDCVSYLGSLEEYRFC